MSETAERLWNALHGGETVSNDKVKPKLPERIRYAADNKNYACIDPKCKAHHDAEYVRADLLATVRREEREAAFRDLLMVAKANLKIGATDALDAGWNLALAEIIAALEASANSEKQVNEDDHRCYNKGGAL